MAARASKLEVSKDWTGIFVNQGCPKKYEKTCEALKKLAERPMTAKEIKEELGLTLSQVLEKVRDINYNVLMPRRSPFILRIRKSTNNHVESPNLPTLNGHFPSYALVKFARKKPSPRL